MQHLNKNVIGDKEESLSADSLYVLLFSSPSLNAGTNLGLIPADGCLKI